MVGELYLEAMMGTEMSATNQPSSKERAFAAHQLARLMSHPKAHGEKVQIYKLFTDEIGIQWGSENRTFEIWRHSKTGNFSVPDFKWSEMSGF